VKQNRRCADASVLMLDKANKLLYSARMMTDELILAEAIRRFGTVTALARALGIRPMTAYQWKWRKRLPKGWRSFLLEKLTDPKWP